MIKSTITGIGQRLKKAREQRGVSLRFLAKQTGVTPEALRKIEEGITRSPRVELTLRLAEYLGLTTEYLVRGETTTSFMATSAPMTPIIRQVRDSTLEISLPYPVELSSQNQKELAKRLSVELEIVRERQNEKG